MPNRGLDELSVSDGTGEAVTANITADRATSATTLVVDSVDNWPQKFIFATGTLNANNYITPASLCIMYGHLDTGDIIIDGYAPGYTDSGNTSGQVAIIKPATYWADEVVALAQVVHDNDGKLKVDAPITGGSTIADGWISAEPSSAWTYSAWDATTRIAQITVPTDATTKYQAGDRVKFTQPTDGVKYGIIHKVEATTLHVFLPSGTDFDNEDVTSPFFSRVKNPFGFDSNPILWSLTPISGQYSVTSPATIPTQFAGLSFTMPVGTWDFEFAGSSYARNSGTSSSYNYSLGFSTANNSYSDPELAGGAEQADQGASSSVHYVTTDISRAKRIKVTSPTTYYAVYDTGGSNITNLYWGTAGTNSNMYVRLTSAYL